MLLSHRRNRRVLLTCILAAAASTILALALTARADASDIGQPHPNPPVGVVFPWSEPCASQAPDATATLPYPGKFILSSPDTSYGSHPCRGYVVDASVAATPNGDALVGVEPPSNYLTQPVTCNWLRMSVTFYNVSAGKFTLLARGKLRGDWIPSFGCELQEVEGFLPFGPGYLAAPIWPTTWRVAASVRAETGGGSFLLPVTIVGISQHF
jgi:hypothetical protein